MERAERSASSPKLEPLGDRAWLARFEREEEASAWASLVRGLGEPGLVDAVAAYRTAAVYADPEAVDLDALEARLRAIAVPATGETLGGHTFRVPVRYDGEDLAEVARLSGMGVEAVVALHAGAEYVVQAIGFLPGFPYLGDLPGPLVGLPRREPPRTRVPAGSVAIAGRQTGIYPGESPGGWLLIGRTPLVIADLAASFFPMVAGDRVRFEPIDAGRFEALRGRRLGSDFDESIGEDPGRPS